MAIVITEEEFDGTTFPEGVEGHPMDGTMIKVRRVDADIFNELRKPHVTTSMEVDRQTRRMVQVEKVDNEAVNDAILDYIIQDFSGFVDKDKNPLPVTLDNKKKLMKKQLISEWVWAMANSLQVIEEEQKAEEEKN